MGEVGVITNADRVLRLLATTSVNTKQQLKEDH